ncbi:MAG: hypothetical protein HWD92_04195 [Flavobacteriia bacterium]|nr:hypothetical protein [Flavobacteriia bacterium]
MVAGLFRTIFFLVLAWFVFRTLDRLFSQRRGSSSQGSRRGASKNREQEIIVRYDPRQTKSAVRDDVGEVVEFEEIEEEK